LHALVQQFPSTPSRFSLAYDESVSAIDFLVRTYGRDALVALIRSYAEGVSDDAAFSGALGVDTLGFEDAWLADLGVEKPVPFGPLPAPPGDLPPDWVQGPAQTPKPGVSGPITTPRPADPDRATDIVGPILIGIVIALVVVLAAGLLVTARRLSRGEALFPSGAPVPDEDEPDEPTEPNEPGAPPVADAPDAPKAPGPPGASERP
jgi:hypothetical protein